jgi:hypothetical protein
MGLNIKDWKLYRLGPVLVWGRKSAGGGFYDVTIPKTGLTGRYLAEVFESLAKEDDSDWKDLGPVGGIE